MGWQRSTDVLKFVYLLSSKSGPGTSAFPVVSSHRWCCCCCCQVASVMSNSVQPRRWQPTRLRHPWDSPGKNTGVGCHFVLQCLKVRSESEVAQSCPTLCDPMDCNLSGSSVHGIFQARVLEWGAIAFSSHRWATIKQNTLNSKGDISLRRQTWNSGQRWNIFYPWTYVSSLAIWLWPATQLL